MTSLACLKEGFELIFKKGIKRYSLGPLVINVLLYVLIGFFLFEQISRFVDWGVDLMPGWLAFLVPIVWLIFAALGLLLIGYSFAILAMIVCSPFHGLLAERVAESLDYRNFDEQLTAAALCRMALRAFKREWTKLCYNLPRTIGVLLLVVILSFVPLVNLLVPVISFLWAAWSMAIQFIDYPADNDQIEFKLMLEKMRQKRTDCLLFGGATAFLLSIPIINLLTISAAVAGATKFWLEEIENPVVVGGVQRLK